jgi:thioredoxin 1/putative thioredoxin
MTVLTVTDESFETEVMQSEQPVLVDLYADWCGPCKQLSPIIEALADELEGKLKVVKVDVDRSPRAAQTFRVRSIPTVVLVHEGRVVDQRVGLVDRNALLAMVEPVLPSKAQKIGPRELATAIDQGRAQPVDVRDAGSFGRYRIPGAIHVDADAIVDRSQELLSDTGRLFVLYDRAGERAQKLAERLHDEGAAVGFLDGGFLAWEAESLEVERGG